MFRQIVTTILLLAFAAQTFDKALIVADYYLNTDSYLRNCENKTRPQLQCKGKCQMMKKLKEEEKKEQENAEQRLGIKEVVSSKSFFTVIADRQSTLLIPVYFHANSGRPVDRSYSIFHPPSIG